MPTPFETDREALVALYNATDGRNWFRNDNWLSDKPIKEWAGARTDDAGRVVALTLTQNRLIGEMPAELGNLANLTHLFLADNLLSGEIPAELGNLSNLTHLFLADNLLSGEIPAELGNLSNLTHLVLGQNQLSGEIPPEWGNLANLTEVTLLGNRFTPGPLFSCYRVSDCPEYAAGNRNSHWYVWQAALYPPPSEDSIMRYYHDTGSLCEDDEPECDTAYTLLELRLMDYPLAMAMAMDGLYWLRDGVTKDEASFVDAVFWLLFYEIDRDVGYSYDYVYRDRRWLRPPEGQPLPNIVGIADLQWVRDGITDYESSAIQIWNQVYNLDRSIPEFIVDGVTRLEADVLAFLKPLGVNGIAGTVELMVSLSWVQDGLTKDDLPTMEFLRFLNDGFLYNPTFVASESFYQLALPTGANPDRLVMVGASPYAEFERSPETRSIGVEGALRRSRDTIIESILEVERIMGFPATESNIHVYLEEQLEGVLGVNFDKEGIYLIGRSITWTSLAAHEVSHYYFGQRNSPYWFYEGVGEYIGEIAQRNVDSPPSDVVGNDVTAHMRKGALEFCEREGDSARYNLEC